MPHHSFETRLGTVHLEWDSEGLTSVRLPGGPLPDPRQVAPPPSFVTEAARRTQLHLAGTPQSFAAVPLASSRIAPFHGRVYACLREVPVGSSVSYTELARRAGSPGASRAVGSAMARNPWPLIVPCHRVVTERGALGGFSAPGGSATKARLLALEGAPPDAAAQLTLADRRLGAHIARVGPPGLLVTRPASLFAALARSIVYQQLTGKAAATILARVQALYPGGLAAEHAAAHTARLEDRELLACGLSRSKLAAFRDLGAKAAAGELPTVDEAERLGDDELVEMLSRVRGIGRWSVEMFMMFSLGRSDVLPVGDYGVRKGFSKLFKLPDLATEGELRSRGERWRPFRSVATWYLWRAADLP